MTSFIFLQIYECFLAYFLLVFIFFAFLTFIFTDLDIAIRISSENICKSNRQFVVSVNFCRQLAMADESSCQQSEARVGHFLLL